MTGHVHLLMGCLLVIFRRFGVPASTYNVFLSVRWLQGNGTGWIWGLHHGEVRRRWSLVASFLISSFIDHASADQPVDFFVEVWSDP